MGWQTLSASLRRWDSGKPSGRVEAAAAVEEVLAGGDDEEALRLFAEALDPSLAGSGTQFLQQLAKTEGAKCRCDAVWYGDTIAYGCKTCGLSSASCICVFCFDAGEHEGHDFYISRSDYGCCDCGDAYAWRRSGFCRHHPGPRKEVDPAQLLPEATRRRAHLLIPAQVKRLAEQFQPMPFQASAPSSSTAERSPGDRGGASADRAAEGGGGDRADVSPGRLEGGGGGGAAAAESGGAAGGEGQPVRVLVTGVNLRMSEEQLRDYFVARIGGAAGPGNGADGPVLAVELVRDAEAKASKGRVYLMLRDQPAAEAAMQLHGEILRGSSLRVHTDPEAIAAAEKRLQAWEANLEWLLSLGGFHDGLRKIIGQVFLDETLLGEQSAVEVLLRHSHLMEPSVRKLETNLMVDLMLDLDFKHRFAQVFTRLYRELVLARAGNQDTNELGDFTCQIFTRQDVTLELVREHNLVRNLVGCLWDLLRPALLENAVPAVFNHESNIFKDHEIIQCSMDLLYVLDHAEVAKEIVRSPHLRSELWRGWMRILVAMQAMNPHERRSGSHVEFTNPAWGNALTLHTDLMSNTWLILDAVEQRADIDAVQEMARWTWAELRAWMVQVHAAEGRAPEAWSGPIEYEVSRRSGSFHLPVNRVLALLLHHLCIRGGDSTDSVGSGGTLNSVHTAFAAVGLGEEVDVLWWMEHPLRALVLHSQVSAGLWRRNGEALENESEFYRMNYWHHLLIDMDLLILRMAAMLLRPDTFFTSVLMRFELGAWLRPGDPVAALAVPPGVTPDDELGLQKLQSFALLLYHLLSAHTPLCLAFKQLVVHVTRQFLSVGPKSHSQLWDPRLERSTATATARDQQMLEAALREISNFSEADGAGHTSAKYHLKDSQWTAVDPYFHLFSWSEQQKAEENIAAALKARGRTLQHWLDESAALRPQPFEVYRASFYAFAACNFVQAFCWILLSRLAFRHLKENAAVADGRLLVLALHVALRSVLTPRETNALDELTEDWDNEEPVTLREDEVQLPALASAMAPHLVTSARRRVRVRTAAFFDPQLLGKCADVPAETDVMLLDSVERLCTTSEESSSGALARNLRARLLQDPKNRAALEAAPRPWFRPAAQPPPGGGGGGGVSEPEAAEPGASGAATVLGEGDAAACQDEARRAKRRRAAQERQQRMLDDLKRRQAAFITGAQGQQMLEEVAAAGLASTSGERGASAAAECVVCISQQEGEDGDNPIGLLCFMRPAAASCLPRARVPPERAVLLQAPKSPIADARGARGPQCFAPDAPDGLVLVRACSHRMHYTCWRRFRPAGIASSGGRLTCPYCGTVANALLPASEPALAPNLLPSASSSSDEAPPPPPPPSSAASASEVRAPSPRPRRHADASADFEEQLRLQLRRLPEEHRLPEVLSEALGLDTGEEPAERPPRFPALAKLCADGVALAEVRLRARPPTTSSSSRARPDGTAAATAAMHSTALRYVLAEALEGAPNIASSVASLAANDVLAGTLASTMHASTPHGRFQMLTAMLIGLATDATRGASAFAAQVARRLLYSFYLVEIVFTLSGLAADALIESELRRAEACGPAAAAAAAIWLRVKQGTLPGGAGGSPSAAGGAGPLATPVWTCAEASQVLQMALNPFLAKVHLLLSCLSTSYESPFDASGSYPGGLGGLALSEEHRVLANAQLGLPDINDLLLFTAAGAAAAPAAPIAGGLAAGCIAQWLGHTVRPLPGRLQQPSAPVLLVLVLDPAGDAAALLADGSEPPRHVWIVSAEGFERLTASAACQAVELRNVQGVRGRLFCVAYRLTLPVVTGRVYQKFYTQFVHARCTVCHASPPIPTLCLLCGTFLCCNSECCRRRDESGQTVGEVTQHALTCGFGTCVFLQLSNSLVHIVADGFIACWGSLYLDGHGEEEYNLARPLHISEARLQQLTQSVREVSFDFESRLKWKKVIFV